MRTLLSYATLGATLTACSQPGDVDTVPDAGAAVAPPFTTTAFDKARIDSNGGLPTFQKARGTIDFGTAPIAKATLVIDLGTTCFPFESWRTNPPPAGETFPADCDAFDRNFEISLDDPPGPLSGPATGRGPLAFELARLITPFGGPLHAEVDVTDLANALHGAHTLQAYIATWPDREGKVSGSDGGWTVSAKVDIEPGTPPRQVLSAQSIVNGSVGPKDSAHVVDVPFTLPEGTTRTRVEHRVTGHGQGPVATGCVGPAEEFCQRTHFLQVDGEDVDAPVPWIASCASHCTLAHYGLAATGFDYCTESPTGNIASVRAPRANWCPGTLTEPLAYDVPLKAGAHTFGYGVKQTIPEGGSWRVSTTIFAYRD